MSLFPSKPKPVWWVVTKRDRRAPHEESPRHENPQHDYVILARTWANSEEEARFNLRDKMLRIIVSHPDCAVIRAPDEYQEEYELDLVPTKSGAANFKWGRVVDPSEEWDADEHGYYDNGATGEPLPSNVWDESPIQRANRLARENRQPVPHPVKTEEENEKPSTGLFANLKKS